MKHGIKQGIKFLVATVFVVVAFLVTEQSVIAQPPEWAEGCDGDGGFCGVAVTCPRGGGKCKADFYYEEEN